jgi:FHS family L-fucose permease-like MFS transporter
LNLAQCLFPLGSIVGIVTARWLLTSDLVLPQSGFSYSIAHPYIVVGACVLLLAFVFEETRFPSVAQDRRPGVHGIRPEIQSLLARPHLRFAMLSQFCGIVAVGMIWALTVDTVRAGIPHLDFLKPSDGVLVCMGLFGIGRLIGTALMHKYPPSTVLLHFALGGIVMAVLAVVCGGMVGVVGVLSLSFALSITWPTILGLAIQGLEQEMKIATALLASVGAVGAVAYHIALTIGGGMNSTIELAITALCFAVIACYARASAKAIAPQPR